MADDPMDQVMQDAANRVVSASMRPGEEPVDSDTRILAGQWHLIQTMRTEIGQTIERSNRALTEAICTGNRTIVQAIERTGMPSNGNNSRRRDAAKIAGTGGAGVGIGAVLYRLLESVISRGG